MNLTKEERLQIITLSQHTSKSIMEIAISLNMPKSSVQRVIKKFRETGIWESSKVNNGKRIVIRESKLNAFLSTRKLSAQWSLRGISISKDTVSRRLIEAGRFTRKPITCPILTNVMKTRRLDWARSHEAWTLDMWRSVSIINNKLNITLMTENVPQVIFSDERMIEVQPKTSQFVRRSWNEPIANIIFDNGPNFL